MLHSGAAAVALWGAAVVTLSCWVQLYLGGADLGSGRGGFIAVLSWMKIGLLEVDAVLACFVDCSVICALSVLSNEMYANLCLSALLEATLYSKTQHLLTSGRRSSPQIKIPESRLWSEHSWQESCAPILGSLCPIPPSSPPPLSISRRCLFLTFPPPRAAQAFPAAMFKGCQAWFSHSVQPGPRQLWGEPWRCRGVHGAVLGCVETRWGGGDVERGGVFTAERGGCVGMRWGACGSEPGCTDTVGHEGVLCWAHTGTHWGGGCVKG